MLQQLQIKPLLLSYAIYLFTQIFEKFKFIRIEIDFNILHKIFIIPYSKPTHYTCINLSSFYIFNIKIII